MTRIAPGAAVATRPGSLLGTVGFVETLVGFALLLVELVGAASTDWVRVVVGAVLVVVGHAFVAVSVVLAARRPDRISDHTPVAWRP